MINSVSKPLGTFLVLNAHDLLKSTFDQFMGVHGLFNSALGQLMRTWTKLDTDQ